MLKLAGIVRDSEGNALPGATVLLNGNGGVTDAQGFFSFKNVCSGSHTLLVKFVGFLPYESKIELSKDLQVSITLREEVTELRSIEISGQQVSSTVTNTSAMLTTHDLDHQHGKSLGESLKTLAGVNALQVGPAIFKPVIHGLHSQRILILNNGIRQEGQQWGIEHAPEIDPFIASEITVVKGAEAVRYGADAIGGVIIINPPSLHNKAHSFGGEINSGFMTNSRMAFLSGMVEGELSKTSPWSWRLQATSKRGGDFNSPGYVLSNTGVREVDFSGSIGYKGDDRSLEIYTSSFNSTIGILRAAHSGNLNDLQTSIENGTPWYVAPFSYDINNPKQKIHHQLLKVQALQKIKGVGELRVLYGGQYNQRKEFDIRRGGRSDRPALFMKLFSNVLDVLLDHDHPKHSGSIGINASYKQNINETGETGIRPLIPDYRLFSSGIFLVEKIRRQNWLFEAGARYDYQNLNVFAFTFNNILEKPSFNFHYLSGSLGTTYYISRQARLNTHLGISSRPPHVSELYSEGLHHGTGAIEEGLMRVNGQLITDPTQVKKEMSTKWITSLQLSGERLSADFSVYINAISNYVFLRPVDSRLTIRGYFPVWQYEQTDAVLRGADVSLNWNATKKLKYTGKFAYLYGEDAMRNDVLIFIPPISLEHGLSYTTDVGRLNDFFVSISIPTVLKQHRAPITVYPKDIPDYTGSRVYDISPAPEGYTLVNVELGINVPVKENKLSLSIAGENLGNVRYRNYMNRLRYFADDVGRTFILRLNYNFHSHN
ncbi:MAG: TonB-dependent receptor [Cyclobacteriaceae bacterium]|nr:TonB-dependent receptor [Cyclobacteriaceae bacterium]UYN86920.1 MAG: TonB-dependent receptor [Cyclobacteriaceae bacterium]